MNEKIIINARIVDPSQKLDEMGSIIIDKNGKKIGKVTSAVYSPRLKKNIALAMVEINHSEIGNNLKVISDDKEINSTIIEKPFYDPKKKIASS